MGLNYGIRYQTWNWNIRTMPLLCTTSMVTMVSYSENTLQYACVSFNTVQCKENPVYTFYFVKILLNMNFNCVPTFKSQTTDSYSMILGNSYTVLKNWKPVWWYDTLMILSLYSFPALPYQQFYKKTK